MKEQAVAGREKLGAEYALDLAREASKVIVAKGRKVVSFDMKNDPPEEQVLLKHMLGPTGNLRAPIVKKGKTVIVGFNQEVFEQEL